ncbi:glutamate-5-semialdehyde dehydrogenase [Candidatus Haliotispira prima]|uniref:Gamma-glutamyl phosphate reductase n=1 Tax=Candidatus Haliotispira prima TaxID=3034016 RepID=A0ABY8MDS5_9SPIO|nr:glutamate-5-semialdehyde dehydrogenase [Candidatus Haliotispira prima]
MTDLQQQLKKLKTLWRKEKSKALEQSSILLCGLAAQLRDSTVQQQILTANQKDLAKLRPEDSMYDRLLLNEQRLTDIATDLEQVAALPGPVGQELYRHDMANGVQIHLQRVPIGLVLVIYESRPNVTIDLFALALRTGNLLLLKGGKEAFESNSCLVGLIRQQLEANGLNAEWVTLLGTSREECGLLLQQHQFIDLCIPRGSASLIRFVREHSQVPVIETGAGVVHLFCDRSARPEMAAELIYNSKMRRLSVCNALDCLLLHRQHLPQLPRLVAELAKARVKLHCDQPSYTALESDYPAELLTKATEASYGQEFLSAGMCVKVVDNLAKAIEHIEQYGSHHTEVIVTEEPANAILFCEEVDAASIFVNMASGFSDGGQFGLGAEVGISTQKLHARGPMGLEALTCAKWFGQGNGQTRS